MSSSTYSSGVDESHSMDPAKRALCIRNVANFSAMKPAYLVEKPVFHPELLKLAIPMASPKLEALFNRIERLDRKDMQTSGKRFKHMIFTDLQNNQYGVKLLASAFSAKGFIPAFRTVGTGFGVKSLEELNETAGNNFGVLCSKKYMDRNMSIRFRKAIMDTYNSRPDNIHGEHVRFMILDQGFKEGIDLFDVKYIHLFEPLTVRADEKQAIGRGTRFCGQKGLEFHPRFGWTLYVFRYDVRVPEESAYASKARTLSELYLEYSNIDLRRVFFAAELEKASQEAAVDHALTAPVHQFKMEIPPPALQGGAHLKPEPPYRIMNYGSMGSYIRNRFMKYKYPPAKLENLCVEQAARGGAPQLIQFTPTQEFVRHYFQPSSAYKGLLLYHATGTGKTCSAIATATTSFEKEGYTILWVTRHTLKSDIWKNMYKQVCSLELRKKMRKGELHLPEKISSPMKYLSERWMEPMSYKQFTNMLLKKNRFYEEILKRNGETDPLHKTLIIIDEAHKLYAPSAPASEKPDMETFEKMIQNSYKKSGKDSCRILLMTATPFTEDGMEMIQLLNLLKEKRDHLPVDFDMFSQSFLDQNGKFTKKGLNLFRNEVSGYISYLNRSQDGRNFAHPVVEDILVDMTLPPGEDEEVRVEDKDALDLKWVKQEISDQKKEIRSTQKMAREAKKNCVATLREKKKECKEEAKAKYQTELDDAKDTHNQEVDECKSKPRKERVPCKTAAKESFQQVKQIMKESHQARMNDCDSIENNCEETEEAAQWNQNKEHLERLLLQKQEIQENIRGKKEQNKTLMNDARVLRPQAQELNQTRKEVGVRLAEAKDDAKKIQDKELRKQRMKEIRETLGAEYRVADAAYKHARAKMNQKMNERRVLRVQQGKAKLGDLSQETALSKKCKVDVAY